MLKEHYKNREPFLTLSMFRFAIKESLIMKLFLSSTCTPHPHTHKYVYYYKLFFELFNISPELKKLHKKFPYFMISAHVEITNNRYIKSNDIFPLKSEARQLFFAFSCFHCRFKL